MEQSTQKHNTDTNLVWQNYGNERKSQESLRATSANTIQCDFCPKDFQTKTDTQKHLLKL